MKKLIKRLCSALIVAIVMRPGLEAAPHEASSTKQNASPASTEDKADDVQSKTIHHPSPANHHINDLKEPGYEVHVHDYHPPPPPGYVGTIVEMLKYLEKTFHFIDVVDKNDLLATDLVDSSWYEWLDYMHQIWPLIDRNKIHADHIENPEKDAPSSIWHSMLYAILKRHDVHKVDETDVDKDGNKENDINVQYTTIKFDPIGQLFNKGWTIVKEYSGYDSLGKWWEKAQKEFKKYSAFKHDKVHHEEVITEAIDGGVHLPEGVLTFSAYDPVVLGINTLLFIGWHALFWASYLPVSGVENLFADYPDIDPDNPDGELDDYADADYADADAADADAAADGGDGAGGDGDGGRLDYYDYYNYDYVDYNYYDSINRRRESVARIHSEDANKHSLSSNYYSHGAVAPHEAYTLADTNIYVKK